LRPDLTSPNFLSQLWRQNKAIMRSLPATMAKNLSMMKKLE
jgi:hypothetical protein